MYTLGQQTGLCCEEEGMQAGRQAGVGASGCGAGWVRAWWECEKCGAEFIARETGGSED